jgi:uncharacterized membrane protein
MNMDVIAIVATVVGIPMFFAMLAEVSKRWIALKEAQITQTAHLAAEKAAAQAAHVEKLEARVRVLERIATDKGVALADQIDALDQDRLN